MLSKIAGEEGSGVLSKNKTENSDENSHDF